MPISKRWTEPMRTGNSVSDTQLNQYSNTLSPQTQRTDHHHRSSVKSGKKNYYKCLPWHAVLATIFVMLAISAVLIPTLLGVFIKTNYFPTNNTKCVNLTAICSTSVNYSDPCNGNIPVSKYIFNREVYCRRDATGTAVLGYYFSCVGAYASCSRNSDCGQDGYCDQYCVINSCGGSCNVGLGNCAKLATGLNCGITLSD